MFGISWGGFNSIHMAMRRPPALKAIIAVDATDDLYQDDVHFMDGIMHVDSWEMSQDLANAVPGAPDYVLDERYFADRFDQPPWMLTYKAQQRDGPFWDRTALNKRYESIRIPVFMIGGWYDGYRDSIPRMLEHLKAPQRRSWAPGTTRIPTSHTRSPGSTGATRPSAGSTSGSREKTRDHEGAAPGRVRPDWHPPGPYLEEAPGHWRYEDGWPIARIRERVLHPRNDRSLGDAPGAAAWTSCATCRRPASRRRPGDVVGRRRAGPAPTDAFSLVYDTPPLERTSRSWVCRRRCCASRPMRRT
jgi:predicted acyl esterase